MTTNNKLVKPLGIKAYGSIPHLPGSRLGPGDHHCHEGQAKIATEKARDKHDVIIVQEKLDGSNVCVARINGGLQVLTRSGYRAIDSPYEQHHKFANWVYDNIERFSDLLKDGERICGEWLAQAHGTRYHLHHALIAIGKLAEANPTAPNIPEIEVLFDKFLAAVESEDLVKVRKAGEELAAAVVRWEVEKC